MTPDGSDLRMPHRRFLPHPCVTFGSGPRSGAALSGRGVSCRLSLRGLLAVARGLPFPGSQAVPFATSQVVPFATSQAVPLATRSVPLATNQAVPLATSQAVPFATRSVPLRGSAMRQVGRFGLPDRGRGGLRWQGGERDHEHRGANESGREPQTSSASDDHETSPHVVPAIER